MSRAFSGWGMLSAEHLWPHHHDTAKICTELMHRAAWLCRMGLGGMPSSAKWWKHLQAVGPVLEQGKSHGPHHLLAHHPSPPAQPYCGMAVRGAIWGWDSAMSLPGRMGCILGHPSSPHHPLSLPAETTSASTSSFMPPPTTKICDKGAVVGSGAVAVCWTAGLVLAAYGVLFI